MSFSTYKASNAVNCNPRPSEAREHAPKFTLLGGSCCKERVGCGPLVARGRQSG